MSFHPSEYRPRQPRATLTLPSTVLQRPVYNAVFTARLVGYLNCDLGGGGGGQFSLANSSGVCSLDPSWNPYLTVLLRPKIICALFPGFQT